MDRITLCELEEWQRAGRAFTLLDVRRARVRQADGADIPGAHGHELGQGAAATLRAMGLDARHLVDGYAAWAASGRAVLRIG